MLSPLRVKLYRSRSINMPSNTLIQQAVKGTSLCAYNWTAKQEVEAIAVAVMGQRRYVQKGIHVKDIR
jgi:hypothetical protein